MDGERWFASRQACWTRRGSARDNSIVTLHHRMSVVVERLREGETNVPSCVLLLKRDEARVMQKIERDATYGESCCEEAGEEVRR